jgi:hypothetical protein
MEHERAGLGSCLACAHRPPRRARIAEYRHGRCELTDSLFVAETNPALPTLEIPDLMRRFGLILVNADGFDPAAGGPGFVLRATQNVQACGRLARHGRDAMGSIARRPYALTTRSLRSVTATRLGARGACGCCSAVTELFLSNAS